MSIPADDRRIARYSAAMAYFQNTRLPQILAEKHPVKRAHAAHRMVLSANDFTPSGLDLEERTETFTQSTMDKVGHTLLDDYEVAMNTGDFATARVYHRDCSVQHLMSQNDPRKTRELNEQFVAATAMTPGECQQFALECARSVALQELHISCIENFGEKYLFGGGGGAPPPNPIGPVAPDSPF